MELEQIYRITNSGKIIPVGELVRCKDCMFNGINDEMLFGCSIYETYAHRNGEWFCADGKRKD